MNSPPSLHESDLTAFFLLGLKKKPFKNLKTIPILILYEYCLHLGLLWCQQYFRFWDCFFLHPMEEKNRSNHCSLPLSRVDRKKCTLPQIKKKTIPLWYEGYFTKSEFEQNNHRQDLFKRNHTRSPVQFCSFFSITKRLSLSAELQILCLNCNTGLICCSGLILSFWAMFVKLD